MNIPATYADAPETPHRTRRLTAVLARRKGLLVGLPLLCAAVGAAATFALPDIYRANVRLLPPQQAQSGTAALLAQLGGAGGAAASLGGLKNPADVYVGMLKSRTIADTLIAKHDLKRVYDTPSQEKARRILAKNTGVTSEKEGFILVSVDDTDPKRAAVLGNAYVAALTELTSKMAVTEATQRRAFFERQLLQTRDNLANAEIALKGALDTQGVISVDSESRAIVETVGRVRAQISAKEIELSSMEAFVTRNNQEYLRVKAELASLREELSKLENGRPGAGRPGNAAQTGLGNIKILRDVKYHQMLYELLAKQFELARLDEAKDNAVVQVLDAAVEPERPVAPNRLLLTLLALVGGALLALLIILFGHYKQELLAEAGFAHR